MGFNDGFNSGLRLMEQMDASEQRKIENARQAKRDAAWDTDNEYKLQQRGALEGYRTEAQNAQEADDFEFGGVRIAMPKEYVEGRGLHRKLIGAAPDLQTINNVQQGRRNQQFFQEGAAVRNYLLNAPPEEFDRHVSDLSASDKNGYKFTRGRDGSVVVELDKGAPLSLTRDQMADWVSSRYVYNKTGDKTALARIEALDGRLAALSEQSYKRATDGANLDIKNQELGIRRSEAAANSDLRGAQADYYRGGGRGGSGSSSGSGSVTERLDAREREQALVLAAREVSDARKEHLESLKDPQNTALAAYTTKRIKDAETRMKATQYRTGNIPPDQVVAQVLNSSKTKEEVFAGLKDLGALAGSDYADEIASMIGNHDGFRALPQSSRAPAAMSPKTNPIAGRVNTAGGETETPQATGLRTPSNQPVSGGAVGNAIRAVTSRGLGTKYMYRGQAYPTREAAESARNSINGKN